MKNKLSILSISFMLMISVCIVGCMNKQQTKEEIYDEALFHDSDIDLDDEYMRLYNIKNELEDESLIDISNDQVEMLEEELKEIIDNMNEKVEEAKEKEKDLRAVSALLLGKYLFHEEDDSLDD